MSVQKRPKSHSTHVCMVCTAALQAHELVTGIPHSQGTNGDIAQLYGHYRCVRGALSAEKVVRAVELGLMPLLADEAFAPETHILQSTMAKLASKQQYPGPLEKIYEFIKS